MAKTLSVSPLGRQKLLLSHRRGIVVSANTTTSTSGDHHTYVPGRMRMSARIHDVFFMEKI